MSCFFAQLTLANNFIFSLIVHIQKILFTDDAVPDEDCLSIQADSPDFFNDFGDMWEAAEIQNSPEGIEKKDDLEFENVSR